MRYRIHLAEPDTGREITVIAEALSAQEASNLAAEAGYLVGEVVPCSPAVSETIRSANAPPKKGRMGTAGLKRLKRHGLIVSAIIVVGLLALAGFLISRQPGPAPTSENLGGTWLYESDVNDILISFTDLQDTEIAPDRLFYVQKIQFNNSLDYFETTGGWRLDGRNIKERHYSIKLINSSSPEENSPKVRLLELTLMQGERGFKPFGYVADVDGNNLRMRLEMYKEQDPYLFRRLSMSEEEAWDEKAAKIREKLRLGLSSGNEKKAQRK